jgi:hypothetical protein
MRLFVRNWLVLVLALAACGGGDKRSQKQQIDYDALLASAEPSTEELKKAISDAKPGNSPIRKISAKAPGFKTERAVLVDHYTIIKTGQYASSTTGVIRYSFEYQEVNGDVYEGTIDANFVFRVNRFVPADCRAIGGVCSTDTYTVVFKAVTANIGGRVVHGLFRGDPVMEPLTGVLVSVRYNNGQDNARSVETDTDGRYSIRAISGAPITLVAQLPGFEDETTTVTLTAPPPLNPMSVDFVLWPRPTDIGAGLTAVQGRVWAYDHTNSGATAPVEKAVVSARNSGGALFTGGYSAFSNRLGFYYVNHVPLNQSVTMRANIGSRQVDADFPIVTVSGINTVDLLLPDHYPYCTLVVSADHVNVGDQVSISVDWHDIDGDPLYFTYGSDDGMVDGLPGYGEDGRDSRNPITWRAPQQAGTYHVYATVDDGSLTHTCGIDVVVGFPQQGLSDTFNRAAGSLGIADTGQSWQEIGPMSFMTREFTRRIDILPPELCQLPDCSGNYPSGQATTQGGSGDTIAVANAGLANSTYEIDYTNLGDYSGPVFRYDPSNGSYFVFMMYFADYGGRRNAQLLYFNGSNYEYPAVAEYSGLAWSNYYGMHIKVSLNGPNMVIEGWDPATMSVTATDSRNLAATYYGFSARYSSGYLMRNGYYIEQGQSLSPTIDLIEVCSEADCY